MAEAPTPSTGGIAGATALWQAAGAVHWLAVEGHSMGPLLHPGDEVRVQHGRPARVGDIVVVQQAGGLLVHRLIAATVEGSHTRWWTQGDAKPQPDAAHTPEALLGVVTARRRGGRERALDRGLNAAAGRWIARWQWGARGPHRPGRTLRRALVRALAGRLWRR